MVGVAYARAGLLGNPSDGYEGKAIALPVRNFEARVTVEPGEREGPEVRAVPGLDRLIHAAVRRLVRHVGRDDLLRDPIAISCETTIPRQVGLAGSSAVVIATLRALGERWDAGLPALELAEMALAVEVEDLGIAAGPMDRVVQAYERLVVMDLAPPRTEASYGTLDPELLPPMLIAWDPTGGASSGVPHSDLRERWRRGDAEVHRTIEELRALVDRGVEALRAGDHRALMGMVDRNFELRCRVFAVGEADRRMVSIARGFGAAAKLCGSGGAVLVLPAEEADRSALEAGFHEAGFRTCRPVVA